ncbi:MAG: NAD kinase [Bacteroidota bacterium]|nr:NAD kinase [Bacteroidota bacterium]
MNIGIFGNKYNGGSNLYVQKLVDIIENSGLGISVYEPFYSFIKDKINFLHAPGTFLKFNDIINDIKFMFSIGGDGTLLNTLPIIRNSGIPVAGINLGRLGFLATISKEEIETACNKILTGDFTIDSRTTIEMITANNLMGEDNIALNEITVHKKDTASMMTIHCSVNDEFLNSYWADGLIISTPTGSTGYSLSCAGPIIVPESENLIINPIATHNLTVRPIVLPDNKIIKLNIEQRNRKFMVSLDSRTVSTTSDIELIVKKSNVKFNFVKIKEQSFYSTIRKKLMWGLDIRTSMQI